MIEADVAGRRAAAQSDPAQVPSTPSRSQEFGAQMRANLIERDGKRFYELDGYASTVDEPYEMYDFWGPYTEIVDRGAFETTLAAIVQHVQVLEASGLIATEKIGRTRTCRVSAEAVSRAERWLSERREFWEARFEQLGALLEGEEAPPDQAGNRRHAAKRKRMK